MTSAPDQFPPPQQERDLLIELVERLVDVPTHLALGIAIGDCTLPLFRWDAFLFEERVPDSPLFRTLYSVDTLEGKSVKQILPSHPGQPYTSFAPLHEGKPLLLHRQPDGGEGGEDKARFVRFGHADRPSASLLFAPVRAGGELIGILSVQSYTPGRFDESDANLLKSIGDLVAPVLRRLRIDQDLRIAHGHYQIALAQAEAVLYRRDYRTGSLLAIGSKIRDITGYGPDEITPEVWDSMVQEVVLLDEYPGMTPREATLLNRSGARPTWRAQYRIHTRGGRERWLADSSIAIVDASGSPKGSLGIIQDITERKREEILQETLSHFLSRLSATSTAYEAARRVADAAAALIGWDMFYLSFYSEAEDQTRSVLLLDTVAGEVREYPENYGIPDAPSPIQRKAIREGAKLFSFEDITGRSPMIGNVERASQSVLYMPVQEKGQVIGLFSAQSYTPGFYTEESMRILEILADACASTLARTRAQDASRAAAGRYMQALGQADINLYLKDLSSQNTEFLTPAITRWFGYAPEEVTPALWDSLVREVVLYGSCDGMTGEEAVAKFARGELKRWCADYRVRTRSGEWRWITDSAVPVFNAEGRVRASLGILQDVTERSRTMIFNRALTKLARGLSAARTPREVGRVVADVADELIGWDACFINLFIEEEGVVHNVINIDTVDSERAEFPSVYEKPRPPTPMFRKILEQGAQIVSRSPDEKDNPLGFQTRDENNRRSLSLLFVPLRRHGLRNVGQLSIQSYSPDAYTEHDLETLQMLADHCCDALDRTFAEERLRQSQKRTAAMAALGHHLNAAVSVKEAGRIIAQAADQLLGWDALAISLLFDREQWATPILNFDTFDGKKTEVPVVTAQRRPSHFARQAMEKNGLLVLREPGQEAKAAGLGAGVPFGDTSRRSASLLFAPARKGEAVVGIVSVQSYTPHAYTRADLALLCALADYCAGALERLRAEELGAKDRKRIAILAELGNRLAAVSTHRQVAEIVLEAVRELVGWDSAYFLLYNAETDHIKSVLVLDEVDGKTREVSGKHLEGHHPIGFTHLTIVKGPQLILRARKNEGADAFGFGDTTRRSASLMFLPVRKDKTVLGVFSIQSYAPDRYTKPDLELLESLAQHCSGALDRIAIREAIAASERRFALAVRGANDGLWDWNLRDDSIYFSERWKSMLGYTQDDIPNRPSAWLERVHPYDLPALTEELNLHRQGGSDQIWNEHRLLRKDGTYLWCLCRGVAIRDASGVPTRIAGSLTDISAHRAAEDQLERAAFYDALTALPNRSLFLDRLERCIVRSKRNPDPPFALLYLDLDRFKAVNDSLGHLAGDRVLQILAQRLQRAVREGDSVARIGGDEFTILIEELVEPAEALRTAERILAEFNQPIDLGENQPVYCGASIGIAFSYPGYARVEDLLRDADQALYNAKKRGRGTYSVFEALLGPPTPSIDTDSAATSRWAAAPVRLRFTPLYATPSARPGGVEIAPAWHLSDKDGAIGFESLELQCHPSRLGAVVWDRLFAAVLEKWSEWTCAYPATLDEWTLLLAFSGGVAGTARPWASLRRRLDETGLDPSRLLLFVPDSILDWDPRDIETLLDNASEIGVGLGLDTGTRHDLTPRHFLELPLQALRMEWNGAMRKRKWTGTKENEPRRTSDAEESQSRLWVEEDALGTQSAEEFAVAEAPPIPYASPSSESNPAPKHDPVLEGFSRMAAELGIRLIARNADTAAIPPLLARGDVQMAQPTAPDSQLDAWAFEKRFLPLSNGNAGGTS